MRYVIVNTERGTRSDKSWETEKGAKIAKTRMGLEGEVMRTDVYEVGFRKMVPTTNLMTGKTVMIDANQKGGCCDPGTERYWTM